MNAMRTDTELSYPRGRRGRLAEHIRNGYLEGVSFVEVRFQRHGLRHTIDALLAGLNPQARLAVSRRCSRVAPTWRTVTTSLRAELYLAHPNTGAFEPFAVGTVTYAA
ncbi:MAG: hypothetical protein FJW27_16125 [Acidimicrobiia bacterium]|nr:hypothetical protein [Acidimicrobiia bacterium]